MSIPDGEYEIDLLVLDASDDPLVAFRYGFIPDSMDQSKPLTLFMTDQACVLEAPLISKPEFKLLPIIFEGLPQRQRLAANGTLDSYFLTVDEGNATLRRLLNTVRVNKSRNAEKLRSDIAGWRVKAAETQKNGGLALPLVYDALAAASKSAGEMASRKPKVTALKNNSNHTAPQSSLPAKPRVGTTPDVEIKGMAIEARKEIGSTEKAGVLGHNGSKEASVSKPVSVLQNRSEHKAVLQNQNERKVAPLKQSERKTGASSDQNTEKQRPAMLQKERVKLRESVFRNPDRREKNSGGRRAPALPKPASKRPPTSPETRLDIISASDFEDLEMDEPADEVKPRSRARNNDMEDDFKDLEDQLQEVLEDPNASDSDDSGFAPIVIQVSEDQPKSGRRISQRDTTQKPMSLRELYGGGGNDDLSSSEEE